MKRGVQLFGVLFGVFGGILLLSGAANAQFIDTAWSCEFSEALSEDSALICDVSVLKEVSINGGTYADANDTGSASVARVGDTVDWRITIQNLSQGGYVPTMDLLISDVLPGGVTYVSHDTTVGTYDAGAWDLPTIDFDDETQEEFSTLPAVLNIRTTANMVGLWENTATLTGMNCDGWCDYIDDDSENDSDNAFISVQAPVSQPQVLGASTSTTPTSTPQVLASTGDERIVTIITVGSAIMTCVLLLGKAVSLAKK